jgi:hypothetical protein
MTLTLVAESNCPKCGKLIRLAFITAHPSRADAAIHSLECGECGYVKNTLMPLNPPLPPHVQA